MILAAVISPDPQEQAQLMAQQGGREECVWHPGYPLGYFLVLPCPVFMVNRHMWQTQPKKGLGTRERLRPHRDHGSATLYQVSLPADGEGPPGQTAEEGDDYQCGLETSVSRRDVVHPANHLLEGFSLQGRESHWSPGGDALRTQ